MQANPELPPLLLRADASVSQGTGHVMRCLALAQAWKERGGLAHIVTCQPTARLCQRFDRAGVLSFELDKPWPAAADRELTVSVIEHLARDCAARPWLVIDGYHFDRAYLNDLRRTPCRMAVIDDHAGLPHYDADIVLNHGIHAARLNYPAAPDTWLLLGTRYALLRGEFAAWRGFHHGQPPQARKVLVTLGGSDRDNVTAKVIEALERFGSDEIDAQVVIGPLHPRLDALKRRVAADSNIHLLTDVADLARLMAWADVAVAAGGTTAWELAFMQVPALLLALAENQLAVAEGVDDFGAARSLGWAGEISSAEIADHLRLLMNDPAGRAEMATCGRLMVDGLGVERVINAMVQQASFAPGEHCSVRAVARQDDLLLWQWANDPSTRQNSFDPSFISWRDHEAWLSKKLWSSACRMWIIEIGDLPVGQIRYDRVDSWEGASAEISFSIAPGFRGRQLGTKLLQATAELAARELAVGWLKGIAFADNAASRRTFLKAGFEAREECVVGARACTVFRRAIGVSIRSDHHVPLH